MYIILVHWLIKDSEHHEKAFLAAWEKMKVDPNSGLFREILTKPRRQNDAKFNTFSLTDKAYRTFVNVGIWKDVESFDAAISKYIQGAELRKPEKGPKKDETLLAVYQNDWEFKIRERIVLEKITDRAGTYELQKADCE